MAWAFAAAAPALLIPTSRLTGTSPDPALLLDQGALTFRVSWLLVALFLWSTSRSETAAGAGRPLFAALREPAAMAVVAVAAAVRAIRLDAPLWFDEVWMHTDFVSLPLGELLRTYGSDNNHPLYSVAAWFSVALFGDSPWALRLPAALFGVGSVAALYLLARHRVGRREATLAAALLALSFQHVGFSQEARGYTGLLFFGLLSTHALLEALESGRTRAWMLHGLCLALSVATHMTGAFLGFGHLALVLLHARRHGLDGGTRAGLRGLVLGALLTAALHGLLLPQIVHFFLFRKTAAVAGDSAWRSPAWLLQEVAHNVGLPSALAGLGLAVGGALALAGLYVLARRRPQLALLVVVPAAALALVMVGLGRNLWPRLFFFVMGYALLGFVVVVLDATDRIAARFGPRAPRAAGATVAALLVAGAVVTLPRAFALPKQDFPGARDYVLRERAPGETVVTVGLARFPYQHYYSAPFVPVDDVAGLSAAIPVGAGGYVLDTFPVFLESRTPELAAEIHRRGREVARFRGAKGGGDVVVYRVGEERR